MKTGWHSPWRGFATMTGTTKTTPSTRSKNGNIRRSPPGAVAPRHIADERRWLLRSAPFFDAVTPLSRYGRMGGFGRHPRPPAQMSLMSRDVLGDGTRRRHFL